MFVAMLLMTALLTPGLTNPSYEERAFLRYRAALDTYAQLHRDAAAALPEGRLCGGPEQLELIRLELAGEIRKLRPEAREGDIFQADVADALRLRLLRAFADEEGETDFLAPEADDPENRRPALEVNGFYPWEAGPPRWRALFWALPSLPDELEYRFAGRDLVLLDVEARLVVDILRDAMR